MRCFLVYAYKAQSYAICRLHDILTLALYLPAKLSGTHNSCGLGHTTYAEVLQSGSTEAYAWHQYHGQYG